ncbi:MAG: 4Fe-4S dicluster domain-containing protein, partial [Vallitaleaceae bacterium]|nr:4Fe-4S dicluster domain-containing protein [Vallitaleaceae bacterium]
DWEDSNVQSRLCYEVARKHKKPIIVMEPVKGGNLAGMTPTVQSLFKAVHPDLSVASWAVRYAASMEGVFMVLSGMSNNAQLQDNTSYLEDFNPLNDEEREVIAKVQEELKKVDTIPCTACRYCVDDCPAHINIPEILATYNTYKIYQEFNASKGHYNWVTSNGGKASDCIACGACEGHCPQHIAIIDSLAEIARVFEV